MFSFHRGTPGDNALDVNYYGRSPCVYFSSLVRGNVESTWNCLEYTIVLKNQQKEESFGYTEFWLNDAS